MNLDIIPELSVADAAEAVAACCRANRVPFLLGSPGIAKSSVVRTISETVGRRCVTMTLTNYDPADIGGLPVKDVDDEGNATVRRVPFKTLRDACKQPVDLFLDEITSIERATEGPTMRLVLEKWAGDDLQLHPGTRIILAGNFSDETPRGRSLTAAMTNRLVILRMMPIIDELFTYFGYGPEKAAEEIRKRASRVYSGTEEEWQKARRLEWQDFAATALVKPDLFQTTPPEASKNNGVPWGSPRAWEIGLDAYSALHRSYESGITKQGDKFTGGDLVGYAILAGAVGPVQAGAYLAIRDERKHLPKLDEIVNSPEKAKVPDRKDYELALMGMIPRVVEKDAGAAWIYVSRMRGEPQGAAAALISRCGGNSFEAIRKNSKFAEKAAKAWYEVLSRIVRITSGEEKLSAQIPTALLAQAAAAMKKQKDESGV